MHGRMSEATLPDNLPAAMAAIQRHRGAIVEAQHRVLRRELTMPQYNAIYQEHLAAIHALEKRIADLQGQGHGHGPGGAAGQY
jgi:protoporphyrinogen oxidase